MRALNRAKVEYALVGGTALLLAGRDRNTRDMNRSYLLLWVEKLHVAARWDEVLALNAEGL